jgi:hypothetical protein
MGNMAGIYLDPTAMYGLSPSSRLGRITNVDYEYDYNGRTEVTLKFTVNNRNDLTEDKLERINAIICGTNERVVTNRTITQLRTICQQNRQTGSSSFLLKSAIVNPDCYIICRDGNSKSDLRRHFRTIIEEDEIFRNIYESNNSLEPKFKTLEEMEQLRGHLEKPIIFDTSCFF